MFLPQGTCVESIHTLRHCVRFSKVTAEILPKTVNSNIHVGSSRRSVRSVNKFQVKDEYFFSTRKKQDFSGYSSSALPRNFSFMSAQSCLRRNFIAPPDHCKSLRSLSTSAVAWSSNPEPITITDAAAAAKSSAVQLLFPDFPTIKGAEKLIQCLHETTGLPWWSTIICSAFLLRLLLMMPVTLYSFHNSARLQRLEPEIKEMDERLKVEVGMAIRQFGWDQKRAKMEFIKNRKRLQRDLFVRDNCHPLKNTVTIWLQTPLWISVSYALRNISVRAGNPYLDNHTGCSSLTEQGIAWFPDLTCQDSTWILPVMVAAVTLFNVEMTHLNISEMTKYGKILIYGFRSFALIIIPIGASVPSVMVLYWLSSGFFAAVQNLLFEYSPFRRLVRLPQSPTESRSPLQSLSRKAKAKYLKR